jgi:hypothetical protein
MKNRMMILMIAIMFTLLCTVSNAAEKVKRPAPLMFDAGVAVSSLMTISDAYIKSVSDRLEVAAVTEEAASGNWERIKPLLEKIEEQEKGDAVAWFALPDGSYYTVDKGLMDKNLSDRAYFPVVLSGKISVGELVVSKSTNQVSAIIAVPVKKGDSVTGVLGVSLFTRKLSVLINKMMRLPDEAIFYALNKDHITAINKKPGLVFMDPEAQGSSSMTMAIKEMLSMEEGIVEYDFHGKRRVAFMKSNYTGWWYAIGLLEINNEAKDKRKK